MDAIKFIVNEHTRFKQKFSVINKRGLSDGTKARMFKALCDQLVRHETMEQKIWYPNFKNDSTLKPIVKHLLHEEKDASQKIKAFKKLKFNIDWEKQFPKFKNDVIHHATDEEKMLFPKVRKLFDKAELQKIGANLSKFKTNYNKIHLQKTK